MLTGYSFRVSPELVLIMFPIPKLAHAPNTLLPLPLTTDLLKGKQLVIDFSTGYWEDLVVKN